MSKHCQLIILDMYGCSSHPDEVDFFNERKLNEDKSYEDESVKDLEEHKPECLGCGWYKDYYEILEIKRRIE